MPRYNHQILNALTIDVEDWYQVELYRKIIPFQDWSSCEKRVVQNTRKILRILSENKVKATFFILGWIAETHPDIVQEIASDGHEVGTHGYFHIPPYLQTEEEIRNEIHESVKILRKLTRQQILGYRAPSFLIGNKLEMIWEILSTEGLCYDSSILPVIWWNNRMAWKFCNIASCWKIETKKGNMIEFPVSVLNVVGMKVPFSGGFYLRVLPYPIIKYGIKRFNHKQKPAIVYLHPWEMDTVRDRGKLPWIPWYLSNVGLVTMENKIRKLLKDFKFVPLREIYEIFCK